MSLNLQQNHEIQTAQKIYPEIVFGNSGLLLIHVSVLILCYLWEEKSLMQLLEFPE